MVPRCYAKKVIVYAIMALILGVNLAPVESSSALTKIASTTPGDARRVTNNSRTVRRMRTGCGVCRRALGPVQGAVRKVNVSLNRIRIHTPGGCRTNCKQPAIFATRPKRIKTRTPTPTPTRIPSTPTTSPIPTATPTVSPTFTVTPTPSVYPTIPLLTQWESNMRVYGGVHCANLAATSPLTEDERLTATQYDPEAVFYEIMDYTDDTSWALCASRAEVVYRDHYVLPNNGVIPGYWIFTRGLALDYLKTGDVLSRSAVVLISKNAAYTADSTPLSWTVDVRMSREVAYAIQAYLDAEAVGEPHRSRTESMVSQALGHIDQWFVQGTAEYVRPFIFALTAEALIRYHELTGDPRILPALTIGANWIWDNCWLADEEAFKYTDRVVPSGGTEPTPDLNILIAPLYAWLWYQTGDTTHLERADQIFAGGVKRAWLAGAKQFNQNYRYSFDYIKWRTAPPAP